MLQELCGDNCVKITSRNLFPRPVEVTMGRLYAEFFFRTGERHTVDIDTPHVISLSIPCCKSAIPTTNIKHALSDADMFFQKTPSLFSKRQKSFSPSRLVMTAVYPFDAGHFAFHTL